MIWKLSFTNCHIGKMPYTFWLWQFSHMGIFLFTKTFHFWHVFTSIILDRAFLLLWNLPPVLSSLDHLPRVHQTKTKCVAVIQMGSCTFTIYWINKLNNNWFNEVNKQPKWHGKIILTKSSIFSPDIEAGSIGFPVVRNKICFLCAPAFYVMFLLVNKSLFLFVTRFAFFCAPAFCFMFFVVVNCFPHQL